MPPLMRPTPSQPAAPTRRAAHVRALARRPGRAPRLAPTTTALALAVLLAACGGGGDTGDAGPRAQGDTTAADTPAQGRAQALAATLPALADAPAALVGNVRCENLRLGAVEVDQLEVPPGAACRLAGTRVRGSVQVAPGAVLLAADAEVAGSVQAERAAHVQLTGAAMRVSGSVQLEGGGSATLGGLQVAGDIQIEGLVDAFTVRDSQVGGNLQVIDTRGGGDISGNRVRGNLQCSGNLPAPLASGNSAATVEGQCRPAPGAPGTVPPQTPLPPLSGNVSCDGLTLGALTLDTVTVPPGATCSLMGTRLTGNLELGTGARLLGDSIAVGGNVVADAPAELALWGTSRVGGSVQVQGGLTASLVGVTVAGSLQIDAMTGPALAAANVIAGNLQAMGNQGGLTLSGNRTGGVMQCKDNLPAPTGSANQAARKEDQCRLL